MILNIIYQHSAHNSPGAGVLLTTSDMCAPAPAPLSCKMSPGSGGDFDAHYTWGWLIFHNLVTFNHSCHDAIVANKVASYTQDLHLNIEHSL